MLGFLVTLVVAVVGWAVRFPIPPLWYAAPLLVPLILALLISAFLYPSAMAAARIVDRRLELAEQLSTAVEVIAEDPEEMVPWAQVMSAGEAAAWAHEHWRGGPRLGRDLALTAILGFLAAGALLLTGPEGRNLLPRSPLPSPLAQEEAPPAAQPTAAPPRRSRSSRAPRPRQPPSRKAVRPASSAPSRTSGARARPAPSTPAAPPNRLAQAEGELSRQTQQSRTDQQALDRLGQALDQIAAGHEAAEALRRGDYEQAAREIAELGTESDQLSQEAKNQLAQALRQAANDSASSPELSQAERKAADALTGRDYEQARPVDGRPRGPGHHPRAERHPPVRAWPRLGSGQPGAPCPGPAGEQRQRSGPGGTAAAVAPAGTRRSRGSKVRAAGQQGQSNQPQQGQGIGTAPSQGGPPGEQQADDPAPRLDTQGQPVEVDLKPGDRPGSRPGDEKAEDDDKPRDETGPITAAGTGNPGQVTSSAPPEINFVPSGRRDIVREYFRGPGEARNP